MKLKVVPASGERDKKGRKKPPPRKHKGPFRHKEATPKSARLYAARMLEGMTDRLHEKLLAREITPEQGAKQLAPLRTINRVIQNMTDNEFKERNGRAPSASDYQGTLF